MVQNTTTKASGAGLLNEKPQNVDPPQYTDQELRYWGALKQRLIEIRNERENPHDAFDGLTYTQFVEENRKAANTFVKPRENKQESTFVSGTTRQKLYFYLATVHNL